MRSSRRPLFYLIGLVSVLLLVFGASSPSDALGPNDPRRGFGTNAPTPSEWLGSYKLYTGAGETGEQFFAYCLDDGDNHPHGTASANSGFVRVADVPAERGATLAERQALSYILWKYGDTWDVTRAGDVHKAVGVLSKDETYNDGIPPQWIIDEGMRNRGPWTLPVTVTANSSGSYDVTVRVQGPGGTIPGTNVLLTLVNLTSPGVQEGPFGPYVVTDANGQASFTATAIDPTAEVAVIGVNGDTPGMYRVFWGRQTTEGRRTQRVITSSTAEMKGGANAGPIGDGPGEPVEPPDPDEPYAFVSLAKRTTNPAYQSGQGAVFSVYEGTSASGTPVASLTVTASGWSDPILVDAGTYTIAETSAPPGQVITFEPLTVTLSDGQNFSFDAVNGVEEEGRIEVVKLDGMTGEPLAGARFRIEYDSDNNGTYETLVDEVVSGSAPQVISGLRAGKYRVTETVAPPGYLLAEPDQRVQHVELTYGSPNTTADDVLSVTVTVDNYNADLVSQVVDSDGEPVNTLPVAEDGSIPPFRDRVTVANVNESTNGEITTVLYGPQVNGDPSQFVCDRTTSVRSISYPVVGPGPHVSPEFTVSSPGIYTFVSTWVGQNREEATQPCGVLSETLSIPQITTEVSAQSTSFGEAIFDTATLSGVLDGTDGTIEVSLYGPFLTWDDIECVPSDEVWASSIATVGSGTYVSDEFTPPSAGIYTFVETWTASDGSASASHACGLPSETTVVTPQITTEVSAQSASFGEAVFDTATLSGVPDGFDGSITFDAFGPFESIDQAVCRTSAWSDVVSTSGSGTFESALFEPASAGIYTFVATWTSDGGDIEVSHDCGLVEETTVVSPTIVTQVSEQEVVVGSMIFDVSTLTGVPDGMRGTSTFHLYGPFATEADMVCLPEHLYATVSAPTVGSGVTHSPMIEVSEPGVFTFVEEWESSSGEMTATHDCGLPPETTMVFEPTTPPIDTSDGGGGGQTNTSDGGGGADTSSGGALARTGADVSALLLVAFASLLCGAVILSATRYSYGSDAPIRRNRR